MLGKMLVETGFAIALRCRHNRCARFAFNDFGQHVDDRSPILDDQGVSGGIGTETALRRQKRFEDGGQMFGIGMFDLDHADNHPLS